MNVKLLPKGHAMLKMKSTKCPAELRDKVIAKLEDIYEKPPWMTAPGMTAVQIGYPYSIFIANGVIFENIEIELGGDTYTAHESCYSIPHETHAVIRHERVMVKQGGAKAIYIGYLAQVIQHEYDHTQGKLINDKEEK